MLIFRVTSARPETSGLLLIKGRKLMVYLPAGRQVPKLGYVREVETAADQRYIDEDMF